MSGKSFPRPYFPESTFHSLDHAQRTAVISAVLNLKPDRFTNDPFNDVILLDSSEKKLRYYCKDIRTLQAMDPWKIFLMAALCDHVDHLDQLRVELSTRYLRQDAEVDEVIWYQPVTRDTMRLSKVSHQLWGVVQLMLLLEFYETHLLGKITPEAAKLVIALYNHWLQGISTAWIMDRTVIKEVSSAVGLTSAYNPIDDSECMEYTYEEIIDYLAVLHVRSWLIMRSYEGHLLSINMPDTGSTHLYLEKGNGRYVKINAQKHPKLYQYYLQSLDGILSRYHHL